jgi:hypothetical protein
MKPSKLLHTFTVVLYYNEAIRTFTVVLYYNEAIRTLVVWYIIVPYCSKIKLTALDEEEEDGECEIFLKTSLGLIEVIK